MMASEGWTIIGIASDARKGSDTRRGSDRRSQGGSRDVLAYISVRGLTVTRLSDKHWTVGTRWELSN
jgi:hypothetical protein